MTPRQHARSFAQSEQCLAFRPAGRVPLDLLESYACGAAAAPGPPPRTPRLRRAGSKEESSPAPSDAEMIWPQGKPSFSCKLGLRATFHAGIFLDPAAAAMGDSDTPPSSEAPATVGGQGGGAVREGGTAGRGGGDLAGDRAPGAAAAAARTAEPEPESAEHKTGSASCSAKSARGAARVEFTPAQLAARPPTQSQVLSTAVKPMSARPRLQVSSSWHMTAASRPRGGGGGGASEEEKEEEEDEEEDEEEED